MSLTSAEIKRLIKKCAADGQRYRPREFDDYIRRESRGTFTKGQLAGVIGQLKSTGELICVERGIYQAGDREDDRTMASGDGLHGDSTFAQEIGQCLMQTIARLSQVVENTNVMEMNQAEFGLLSEIKRLKEELVQIAERCR